MRVGVRVELGRFAADSPGRQRARKRVGWLESEAEWERAQLQYARCFGS
jgi:hypothetical protein